jgi:polyisoprenoid-binding protein YceI
MIKNMNSLRMNLVVVGAILLISATISVSNNYTLAKDYTVTIHGTSNLHDWDETVGTVSGEGAVIWNSDGSFDLNTITIKMEVHSIKSTEGSMMNNNTYKALKADADPEIVFALSTPLKSIEGNASGKALLAKGKLTIAGITNPIDMQVKVSMQGHDKMAFEGSQTIKMTDYGINPPTALFGTLKTGNILTISFKTNFNITAQ